MPSIGEFVGYPPMTVILSDNRDPLQSWARHEREAGYNRGGVDVVAPVGTPVYAWADGIVRTDAFGGTAGKVITLHLTNALGWKLDYKHLSAFAVPDGTLVKRGYLIGYSGETGAPGQPHVHYNLVDPNGMRRNPWLYLSGDATAGTPGEEDDMYTQADRDRDNGIAWTLGQVKRTLDDANGFVTSEDGKVVKKVGDPIRARFDQIQYSLEANGSDKGIRAIVNRIAKKIGV